MVLRSRLIAIVAFLALICGRASPGCAEAVDVFAAGSLREVVTTLAATAMTMGIEIRPTFGGSGTLRDRIEKGAKPDLLLSADMASPSALAAEGKAVLPAIAFARNRMCLVVRRSLGLGAGNLIDGLLADGARIRTSRPIADPSGDYAVMMFDLMDRAHAGAGGILRAKAARLWDVPSPPLPLGQNPTAALFEAGKIDVAVTYCSATSDITKANGDLDVIRVPPRFDPDPVFGIALLSANPGAARFALLLLSEAGQSAVVKAGLLPLAAGGSR